MKNDITLVSTVDFCGQQLATLPHEDQPYVSMRQICEGIGLAWHGQFEKIKKHPVLKPTIRVIRTVAADGKNRELTCLPLAMLNGWLFSIDASRVKPAIKENLLRYQRECFGVLHNYWFGKPAQPAPVAALIEAEPNPVTVSEPAEKIDQDQERELILQIRLVTRHFHEETTASAAVHSMIRHTFQIANLYDLPADQFEAARQMIIKLEERAHRFHIGMRDIEQVFINKHMRHKIDIASALSTFVL